VQLVVLPVRDLEAHLNPVVRLHNPRQDVLVVEPPITHIDVEEHRAQIDPPESRGAEQPVPLRGRLTIKCST